jgi:hypothetical protein
MRIRKPVSVNIRKAYEEWYRVKRGIMLVESCLMFNIIR